MTNIMQCIINLCDSTGSNGHELKQYGVKTWETVTCAVKRRKLLTSDQFSAISDVIGDIEYSSGPLFYHSKCHSKFCAVKSSAPEKTLQEPVSKKHNPGSVTRSISTSLNCSTEECIFCVDRKFQSGARETLHQCLTLKGSKQIYLAAHRKNDERIIAMGEDLVKRGASYHNSCRRKYIKDPEDGDVKLDHNRHTHAKAFQKLEIFIDDYVICSNKPIKATNLYNIYKEEYLSFGGSPEDFNSYTVQQLLRKVTQMFKNIVIDKQSRKSGIILFHDLLTLDEACTILKESTDQIEQIRNAAMALRLEILNLPATISPTPTTVETLKQCSATIPPLTMLFFKTLLSGNNATDDQRQERERKAASAAADAVYNCSNGSCKPLKQQVSNNTLTVVIMRLPCYIVTMVLYLLLSF